MPLPAKQDATDGAVEITHAPRLHLSSRQVPPGGLTYKIAGLVERDPRAALVGPFNALEELFKEVQKRCQANGLESPTIFEIEDSVCQRLPPGYCRDSQGRRTTHPGTLSLSLSDVVNGTKALGKFFLHGSVPNEEIVRRTYICNACPENVPIAGCQGCAANKLYSVMNFMMVKPLPSDAVLGACSICKCSLKAKTRMKLDDLPELTAEQRARLPEKCWMIAEASPRDNDPRL